MSNPETTRRRSTERDNLMIEGIASQMRKADAPPGPLAWWHQAHPAERERYRAKARNHIEQVGWDD